MARLSCWHCRTVMAPRELDHKAFHLKERILGADCCQLFERLKLSGLGDRSKTIFDGSKAIGIVMLQMDVNKSQCNSIK